jgi:hypothetical protein
LGVHHAGGLFLLFEPLGLAGDEFLDLGSLPVSALRRVTIVSNSPEMAASRSDSRPF